MRTDYVIALLLAVGAFCVAVAVMAAPQYFSFSRKYLGILVWGGGSAALALTVAAVTVAIKGEENWAQFAHWFPLVGMVGCLGGFVCFTGVVFHRTQSQLSIPDNFNTQQNSITSNDSYNQIGMKCFPASSPTATPEDSRQTYLLIQQGPEQSTLVISKSYSVSQMWGSAVKVSATNCIISNFGLRKIVDITFDLKVLIQEKIVSGNIIGTGKYLGNQSFRISGLDFILSDGRSAAFCAYSLAPLFITIILPTEALVTFAGSSSAENVKLIVRSPTDDKFLIWPPMVDSGSMPSSPTILQSTPNPR